MSSVDPSEEELRLHSFTVGDARLRETRRKLSPEEFAFDGVSDEEWDAFYAALAEE